MLNFSQTTLSFDPYLHGVASNVLDPGVYACLLRDWPDESIFVPMGGAGYNKLSLSERNNQRDYQLYVACNSHWEDLYLYIKSVEFRYSVFDALGLNPVWGKFTSRFEFSSMPADGGYIAPHTDIPLKVVTLVVPIVEPGEWDEAWGGGTDLLVPSDPKQKLADYQAPLDQFRVAATVPYAPNQALLFVKSAASWHSAGPFRGPAGKWRRTLTINIERAA